MYPEHESLSQVEVPGIPFINAARADAMSGPFLAMAVFDPQLPFTIRTYDFKIHHSPTLLYIKAGQNKYSFKKDLGNSDNIADETI